MLKITVYSMPSCVQCNATYATLDARGVVYDVVDVTQDAEAAVFVAGLGYLRAPVVVVRKNGEVASHWSGFNPDRINQWAPAITGILVPVAA